MTTSYTFLTAPGIVADNVIIERQSESTITFCEGAKDAYLGYVTLKVSVPFYTDFILNIYSTTINLWTKFVVCCHWLIGNIFTNLPGFGLIVIINS